MDFANELFDPNGGGTIDDKFGVTGARRVPSDEAADADTPKSSKDENSEVKMANPKCKVQTDSEIEIENDIDIENEIEVKVMRSMIACDENFEEY